MSALDLLLGEGGRDGFFAGTWERRALHVRGAAGRFSSLFGARDLPSAF
jgi:hypothetical protein